ncbi:putative ribonuclease H-like domain-containing protein [Tanacetum coccineum]
MGYNVSTVVRMISQNPSPCVDHTAPEVVALINVVHLLLFFAGNKLVHLVNYQLTKISAQSHVFIKPTPETKPPVIPNDVEEDNHDIKVAHMACGLKLMQDELNGVLNKLNMGACTLTRQSYGDYFEVDLQSETRRTRRNFEEQSSISSPWLPSTEEGSRFCRDLLRLAVRGYKDFSRVCYSYMKHGRCTKNGCWKNEFYLNGNLKREEVYVSCRIGFVDKVNPNKMYKLKKVHLWVENKLPRAVWIPLGVKSKLDEDKEGKPHCSSHLSMARPIEKHLNAVKRIFRYLKGTAHWGLWYLKDSSIALTAFSGMRDICWFLKIQPLAILWYGKLNRLLCPGLFCSYPWMRSQLTDYGFGFIIIPMKLKDGGRRFSESTPNVVGSGPDWLFDIDALTRIMNYEPIVAGTHSNGFTGTKVSDNAGQARKETKPVKDYILLSLWTTDLPYSQDPKSYYDDRSKPSSDDGKKVDEDLRQDSECKDQEKEDNINSTNNVNTAGNVNTVSSTINVADYSIFDFSRDDEDDGAVADMNNLDTTIQVSPYSNYMIIMISLDQVIRRFAISYTTRRCPKNLEENVKNPYCVISCIEGSKLDRGCAGKASTIQDERGIVIRNKARLVAQGYTQEEGINYDEVFAPVARIKAIRLFLAYASFKDFVVYQMDVKSAFLYGKIEEEVYVCQPPGFEDPDFPDRVYKVEKALYGLHQAPRAWYETLSTYLLDNRFQRGKIDKTLFIKRYKGDILLMSSMGELTFFLGLQVKQKKDGIFISQDKYVAEILKKFGFTEVKTASTPMETQKPLLKDEDGEEVDVYMYRSMIGSLMYLTSSRPDIMFAVCACARYQVNPKVSHLHVVKRIFRYLKGQPKLSLWYPKDSPFDLVAYTDSDYAGASLDRKSTTGGC